MRYKVGIYVRVSTDEQALRSEGSLETQKLRIIAEVENRNRRDAGWGKVVEIYEDDGFSAAHYRPAYDRLMSDVRKGKVNLIFVADYFRFCRNLLDYLTLAKQLKKIDAKLLSVKDNFDTETAMGQSMVRNYINMAQTERELTAERVSTNFHARALRGLRNGGRILYGFDRNDKDLARLSINEQEAAKIREIFRVYLEEGTCAKAADALNEINLFHKTKSYRADDLVKEVPWTRNALHYVLRNPAYAGLREFNKKNKGKDQQTIKEVEQYGLVKASWPAIVDETTWKTTQESLDFALGKARLRLVGAEKRKFLLTGLLTCAECGYSLMGASGHGRNSVHRYYVHRHVKGRAVTCTLKRIPAQELEEKILARLDRVLVDEGYLDELEAKMVDISSRRQKDLSLEKTQLEEAIAKFDSEIKRTIQVQTQCPDPTVDDIFRDQLRSLGDNKKSSKVRLDEVETLLSEDVDPKQARAAIEINVALFKKAYAKSKATIQKRLLGVVFDSITLGNYELNLYYNQSAVSAEAIQHIKKEKPSEYFSEGSSLNSNILHFKKQVRSSRSFGPRPLPAGDEAVNFRAVVGFGRGDGESVTPRPL